MFDIALSILFTFFIIGTVFLVISAILDRKRVGMEEEPISSFWASIRSFRASLRSGSPSFRVCCIIGLVSALAALFVSLFIVVAIIVYGSSY